ncbi:hypothetical protein CPC08DRAFT_148940 [Agrocybe pediades]|nr:hypothetical protein CPC08DRAFT_148940 [Agrocybe pediades]
MCWSEVFAYSKLGPIQGKIVPKFIDAFMVKSPKFTKGENMAIAMSYVKGGSVTEMCQELGSDKDPDPGLWYPIGLEMIRAVYAVHQQGVAGFHVRDANMLVEKLDPPVSANDSDSCQSHSRYAIKIIDFACASSCDYAHGDGGPIGDQQEAINDVDDLALLIGEICGTLDRIPLGSDIYGASRRRSEFLKWVKKNHGQERCVQALWPALETSTYDDYTPWIKTDSLPNILRSLRSKGDV